jgi:hypothetical protein
MLQRMQWQQRVVGGDHDAESKASGLVLHFAGLHLSVYLCGFTVHESHSEIPRNSLGHFAAVRVLQVDLNTADGLLLAMRACYLAGSQPSPPSINTPLLQLLLKLEAAASTTPPSWIGPDESSDGGGCPTTGAYRAPWAEAAVREALPLLRVDPALLGSPRLLYQSSTGCSAVVALQHAPLVVKINRGRPEAELAAVERARAAGVRGLLLPGAVATLQSGAAALLMPLLRAVPPAIDILLAPKFLHRLLEVCSIAWPFYALMWPRRRSPGCTRLGSCTATSSPRTSCLTAKASPFSSTSIAARLRAQRRRAAHADGWRPSCAATMRS